EIEDRLDAVEFLLADPARRSELRASLEKILDVERLLARVVYQTANARDLLGLCQSLASFPPIFRALAGTPLEERAGALADARLEQLECLLRRALAPDPPLSLREGGLIADGYHADLDDLRSVRSNAREWIADLEARERETTGIRSLKVGFNQVFGYYLEVTRANLRSVPDTYIRKQTLANAERFFTPELKEFESKVLGAEERIRELEFNLFGELRQAVADQSAALRAAARAVAELDVLAGFAEGAVRCRWTRPELVSDCLVDLRAARHPVVERALESGFVPNDCLMERERRLLILTGPNMSGKSTYLRQTALIAIMAQMGCFVPADSARLGVTDRVFTRVGASDDLHLGQSTFMVEMSETANILHHATPRSLVILDEIGRGTSTFDGMAIARAVAEHLHNHVGARTLFATHFHELTRLEKELAACRNYRVAVRENRDEIVFLHRIVPGGADRSYGIYVAQLAGFPECVLERSRVLLEQLERESRRPGGRRPGAAQLDLFGGPSAEQEVLEMLRSLRPEELTPDEALLCLTRLLARLPVGSGAR
ncbi:MAG: DNA mismatch repair protein MutS, partial [Candidatus Eremiobacterota bacterium]